MFKKSTFSICLILLLVSACGQNSQSGFDIVCEHFDALEKHPNLADMSKEERFDFVNSLIKQSLKQGDDAFAAWKLLSTNPEYRYSLFKQASIEITGKPLACPSMERLSSTVKEKVYTKSNVLPSNVTTMKDATWD